MIAIAEAGRSDDENFPYMACVSDVANSLEPPWMSDGKLIDWYRCVLQVRTFITFLLGLNRILTLS